MSLIQFLKVVQIKLKIILSSSLVNQIFKVFKTKIFNNFSFSGYGNNAVEMETTAVYDKETDEIVVNTPTALGEIHIIDIFKLI